MSPKRRLKIAIFFYISMIPLSAFSLLLVEGTDSINHYPSILDWLDFTVSTATFSVVGSTFPVTVTGKMLTIFLRIATIGALSTIGYSALQISLFQRVDRIAKEQINSIRKKPINLFISYRRKDTSGYAGRLYDRLSAFFGNEHVFMDLDKISVGENFRDTINNYIEACDAVIVIIGKDWIGRQADGYKIFEEGDFVRYEIEQALQQRKSIFPVLVNNAAIPTLEQIPPSVSGLTNMQAIEISDARWNYDVQKLIDAIDNVRKRSI